jgi:LacI family transcriptional regulator
MKRVTLRDVARAADVSTMTVSYALRNHPKISKARRESIRALAKSMGYRPDPQIQAAMSRGRSKDTSGRLPVALLNVGRRPETLREIPYYDALVEAATDRFNELGYHIEEFWLREKGMSPRRLREILLNRGIPGVFFPAHVDSDLAIDFTWKDFFTIASTVHAPDPKLHRVAPYNSRNTMIALDALWDKGYRRIGLAGSRQMHELLGFQYAAWYRSFYLDLQGLEPPQLYYTPNTGVPPKEILAWIERQRLDAILTMEHWIGRHLMDTHGLRFPEDLAWATLDIGSPQLAGINQRPDRIGRTAADMLTAALQRNEQGLPDFRKTTLIEGEWVDASTAPSVL